MRIRKQNPEENISLNIRPKKNIRKILMFNKNTSIGFEQSRQFVEIFLVILLFDWALGHQSIPARVHLTKHWTRS